MSSLADRLKQVIDSGKVENASKWSQAAGKTRQQVSTLIKRHTEDPNAGVESDTIRALAKAAGVPFEWLADGKGTIDGPADHAVEYEDRYIHMRNVRQVARDEGYPEDFIAAFDPALDYDGQPPFDLLWNIFKAEWAQRKGKLITHPVVGDL